MADLDLDAVREESRRNYAAAFRWETARDIVVACVGRAGLPETPAGRLFLTREAVALAEQLMASLREEPEGGDDAAG